MYTYILFLAMMVLFFQANGNSKDFHHPITASLLKVSVPCVLQLPAGRATTLPVKPNPHLRDSFVLASVPAGM